ncbi:MAG: C25 family cysteine peptidase [Rudaea sp.]|nr:C25 family cysteine peptidase [Rudaea sp.]
MMFLSLRLLAPCLALILLTLSSGGVACSGRVHIEVKDSGVYALDYAAIAAVQPALMDCASGDLVLLNRGREVPIRVRDDGSGRFAAGSRIEWVGQALHGPESWYDQYSAVNVYLLAAAPGAHARMRELPAVAVATAGAAKPAPLRRTFHFEQENLMLRLSDREMKAGEEPDVWQWAKLTPVDAQPFTYDFDLPDADLSAAQAASAAAADVLLTLDFRGVSNVVAASKTSKPVDHVVEVALNGKTLATLSWDGRDEMHRQLSVARTLLKNKGNSLRLAVPRRPAPGDPQNFIIDVAMFNWMEISYPVHGNLRASTAPFIAVADAPIELQGNRTQIPQLYGSDGSWRALAALGNDRFRTAGAGADVDLFPLLGDPLAPALVRPVAAGDLREDTGGDDYLMVAHPRLLQSIQPLAQFHRERGHKVAVINVDDIYDQFNDGIIHPVAIRNLVAWGVQHWKIKPRYLLLVGDASFDIHHDQRSNHATAGLYALRAQPLRDEMMTPGGLSNMATTPYAQWDPALANRNLIPTWQFPTPEGQSATDNDFVAFAAGDFHPQLAVGRLPVVEPEEVKAIVDKTIAYLSRPAPGPWRRDITFISTNEVASFKQVSDKIATNLEARGFAVNSIYTNIDGKDAGNARATLRDDLDAGNLLVHFIGHGGQFIWRVGPPAELFTLDDVSRLSNAGRYPMVLAMTCFSAPFDHPTEDSIGERFLREPGKGAVAVFAASWENWPNPDYSKALIEQLLKPGQSIGDAIVATKAIASDRIFVQMYNLLGDPAIVLALPDQALQFGRGGDRWSPRVLVRVPRRDFGGDIDVDWIDAQGKTLASQHYQARNTQFSLTPVDKAAQVRVYATDTRDGRSAFGSFSLSEPPKPVAIAAAPVPKAAMPSGPGTARPPVRTMHRGRQADTISQADFDAAPGEAVPAPQQDANPPNNH